MQKVPYRQNGVKSQRLDIPLCPHCRTQTMFLNRRGDRWNCADGATCGAVLPVVSLPRDAVR